MLRVLVDQEIHPVAALDMHVRQQQLITLMEDHTFRAAESADATVVDAVRRLSHPDWTVLQSSDGIMFWAYPPDADAAAIARLERALKRKGVQILAVAEADRARIIRAIETYPTQMGIVVSSGQIQTTPVRLDQRTFWLSRDQSFPLLPSAEAMFDVLKFKLNYEAKYGY